MSGQKFISLIFNFSEENFFGIMGGIQSLLTSLPESCIVDLFFLFDQMEPEYEVVGNVLLPPARALVHFIPCGHLTASKPKRKISDFIPELFEDCGTLFFPLETKECAVIVEEGEKTFLEKLLKENFAFLAGKKEAAAASRKAVLFFKENIEKVVPKLIFGEQARLLGPGNQERLPLPLPQKPAIAQENAQKVEEVPVIFGINTLYSLPAYVTMQSILDHLPAHKKASFHILYNDLPADIIEIGKKLFTTEQSAISFHCCAGMLEDQHFRFDAKHWKPENYLPVLIPTLFADLEKSISVDADMLVRGDISELLENIGAEDKIAVVPSMQDRWREVEDLEAYHVRVKWLAEEIKIKKTENYFNAGLIVFNHKNITKEDAEKTIACIEKRWPFCEETIFNHVFQDYCRILPTKWNFHFDFFWEGQGRFLPKWHEDWCQAQRAPVIVHYMGVRKPWITDNLAFSNEYNEVWNRVIEKIGKAGAGLIFPKAAL